MKVIRWILTVLVLLLLIQYGYLFLFDESVRSDEFLPSLTTLLVLSIVAFMISPLFPLFDYWRKAFWTGVGVGIAFIFIFLMDAPYKLIYDFTERVNFLDPISPLICEGRCQDVGGMVYFVTIPFSYGLYGLVIATLLKKFRKTV